MLAITKTAALRGIEGINVTVEVDSSRGLPAFLVVGLGDAAVKEAGERVRMALTNSGFDYPKGRITVNLYPAWIRKKGSHYDLPIAMGLLTIIGVIAQKHLDRRAFIGELSLEGRLIPIKGILPMMKGLGEDIDEVIVPKENMKEAYLALRDTNIRVIGAENLSEVVDTVKGKEIWSSDDLKITFEEDHEDLDFIDVKGNWAAKEAIVTAISGGHGLIMIGSPGTGKSMLARRIPTILPKMTIEEQIETSMVYSIAGELTEERPIITKRPFRKLSARTTIAGILGGGSVPLPGEISLAHNGVLFMDELLEYGRDKIESLRRPMEEKKITIMRRGVKYTFPADFIFVAASNPCRCGYYGDPEKICRCTQRELDSYRSRLSGPLADRIDMCIELPRIDYEGLTGGFSQSSEEMKQRIAEAASVQKERFMGTSIRHNADMNESMIKEFCILESEAEEMLERAYVKYSLSPRRYFKILKLARTIADLNNEKDIGTRSLMAALGYVRQLGIYGKDDD